MFYALIRDSRSFYTVFAYKYRMHLNLEDTLLVYPYTMIEIDDITRLRKFSSSVFNLKLFSRISDQLLYYPIFSFSQKLPSRRWNGLNATNSDTQVLIQSTSPDWRSFAEMLRLFGETSNAILRILFDEVVSVNFGEIEANFRNIEITVPSKDLHK